MKNTTTSYNQLVIFHCIAKEGNIRAAARKLGMAPPTISQSLKLLENNLGTTLFHRNTRQMQLTHAGRYLLENSHHALNQLEQTIEEVKFLDKAPVGRVAITLPRFVYQLFLQPIMAEFCQRYPDITLEISLSEAMVDILEENIDVGIRFGDRIDENFIAKKLSNPLQEAIFASPSYIEQFGMPQEPTELMNHRFIQYRFNSSKQLAPVNLKLDDSTLTLQPPSKIIVNGTDLVVDAAISGLGIGCMLVPIIEPYFQQNKLIPILTPYWYTYPGIYLYFSKNSKNSTRVRALIDFLVEKSPAFI